MLGTINFHRYILVTFVLLLVLQLVVALTSFPSSAYASTGGTEIGGGYCLALWCK